jgi:hypothetical protein
VIATLRPGGASRSARLPRGYFGQTRPKMRQNGDPTDPGLSGDSITRDETWTGNNPASSWDNRGAIHYQFFLIDEQCGKILEY